MSAKSVPKELQALADAELRKLEAALSNRDLYARSRRRGQKLGPQITVDKTPPRRGI